jgi:iron complex outermembrane receptor protein
VGGEPAQVDPVALQFDTRKTINQQQAGLRVDHRFERRAAASRRCVRRQRAVRQYLALTGVGPTSSGGVPDLDRDYGGIGARLAWTTQVLGGPLVVTVGGDTDRQHERRGLRQQLGDLGDCAATRTIRCGAPMVLRRPNGAFAPRWTATAGIRTSTVRYSSVDHYITDANPTTAATSASRTRAGTGPCVPRAAGPESLCELRRGFETPTFAELAYRPGGSGLNFGLQPATSRATEIGVKYRIGRPASDQRGDIQRGYVETRSSSIRRQAAALRTRTPAPPAAAAPRRCGAENSDTAYRRKLR